MVDDRVLLKMLCEVPDFVGLEDLKAQALLDQGETAAADGDLAATGPHAELVGLAAEIVDLDNLCQRDDPTVMHTRE